MKKLFAVLLVMLMLTGCAPKITQGEVIDKEFTAAYDEERSVSRPQMVGKVCIIMHDDYVYHYNDTWTITIQQYDAEREKMLTATYRVTEDVYNSVDIGDEFVWDETMTPESPEYTRERK